MTGDRDDDGPGGPDDGPGDGPGGIPLGVSTAGYVEQLLSVGQTRRARELVADAIASAPDEPAAHLMMVQVCLIDGDEDGALHAADETCRLAPEWEAAHYMRSLALRACGRYAESELAIRQAIELDPDDAAAHLVYARLLAMCEKPAAALARVEQALALAPDDASALALRAQLLLVVHPREWRISEDAARRALAIDPEDADAHAVFGHVQLSQARLDAAERSFRTALELEPGNQLALQGLAQAVMSRAPLYRPLLHYQLFMERNAMGIRIAVVLGLWVVANLLRQALEAGGYPDAAALVVYGYLAFCAYTWFATPVTRWILRRRYPWLGDVHV